ncbi:MAG TPA: tetraacyldisaccharide 4'-kinase [Dokdonella sp.]|uniref:tetraacyldisaccharide 4'-kinase n=1 Tax=Dokdonella sp. TaxID=2291710 RepID=UPI002D7F6781|nr:tetraacyldisaccharide 4'-kinase [Dokdonella sp.]HET9034494.1 tetraacyldisaccharide 4'-kinase [Dokdonella sp.]
MKQAAIDRIWYGGEPAPLWMRMLVPLYRMLRALVQFAWRSGLRKPVRLSVPVIIVGNITAGGTGKTPLVLALIEALHARGWKPGVVSRGYGGSATAPTLLDDNPDPAIVGDEPSLIRRRSGVPVAIGRQRPDAARLLPGAGVDVILADDGLQNPSLARDIEICVIDGQRRFGNGKLLPAGPLRESTARLQAVDFVVCNGGTPQQGEISMVLRGDQAQRLDADAASRKLSDFSGSTVHAIAAIGNPQRFFDSLRAHRIEVIEHAFGDHHGLVKEDLDFGDDLPILMTEKDAVKCIDFADSRCWKVPVSAQLPASFFDQIDRKLRN